MNKKFLSNLCKFLERELELAEAGYTRVPEKKEIRFPTEHKTLEVLLQLLGYEGKRIYIPTRRNEEKEIVENFVLSDYQKGINVFDRAYSFHLKKKLTNLGVYIEPSRLKKLLFNIRQKLKQTHNNQQ